LGGVVVSSGRKPLLATCRSDERHEGVVALVGRRVGRGLQYSELYGTSVDSSVVGIAGSAQLGFPLAFGGDVPDPDNRLIRRSGDADFQPHLHR
jgi:hypothetical protein